VNEVQSFLLEGRGIRGSIVRLQETWLQLLAQHHYPEPVLEMLGEAVAATVLLGNGLKDKPRVSLQLQGEGTVRLLVIQCSEDLKVRGMAHWDEPAERGNLLGDGRLAVNVDTGRENGFFQGIVPLVSSELKECLEAYFTQSEQLPTMISLFGSRSDAAGIMLQMLPGHDASPEDFATAGALAATVSSSELATDDAATLLPRIRHPSEPEHRARNQ